MPHLTIQCSHQGPLIDVVVGASRPRLLALGAQGRELPAPVPMRGLIDTGASCWSEMVGEFSAITCGTSDASAWPPHG